MRRKERKKKRERREWTLRNPLQRLEEASTDSAPDFIHSFPGPNRQMAKGDIFQSARANTTSLAIQILHYFSHARRDPSLT